MKVITKSVIDMKTGKVLEQESYEYCGPVAECKKGGGGGGGTNTKYVQSPEARKMLKYMMPAVKKVGQAGKKGRPLWDVPSAPGVGSYGVGQAPNLGGYGVGQAPMPTQGWYSGLDENIKAGMMEPYQEASKQLMEQMGAAGMGGSARGGISGNAAAGLGRFWEDAATGMGQQAWGMINPNAMAQWQAQNQAGRDVWSTQAQADMAQWQAETGAGRDIWSAQNQAAQNQWMQDIAARQSPYSIIPGMAGGSMPTPVVTQSSGGKK